MIRHAFSRASKPVCHLMHRLLLYLPPPFPKRERTSNAKE
nr:MAG TPA: hypothetical protein [Caudoviricetes sp.]